MLVEANGIPVGLAVDGANRHDMKLTEETLASIPKDACRPKPDATALRNWFDRVTPADAPRTLAARRPLKLDQATCS